MNTFPSTLEARAADCDPDSSAPPVASVCAESGWPFVERAADCLVKLEMNREGGPFSARVGRAADGELIAWVQITAAAAEIGDESDADETAGPNPEVPACRQAVESIFAQLATRVRLVHGVFRTTAVATVTGLEVPLPADCDGEQLADALAALSVACELAGPEVQLLLSDPVIAGSYLAQSSRAGGCSPSRQDSPDTRVPGEASSVPELY